MNTAKKRRRKIKIKTTPKRKQLQLQGRNRNWKSEKEQSKKKGGTGHGKGDPESPLLARCKESEYFAIERTVNGGPLLAMEEGAMWLKTDEIENNFETVPTVRPSKISDMCPKAVPCPNK